MSIFQKDYNTEKKEAEQKLKESEERYRLITENSNDLIRIFDKDFNFEYINEANHLKQLGYLKEDLIGKNAKIIVHPDEYGQIDEMIKQMLKEGKARREGRIKHKNGEWKWYDIWASLIEIQKGNWKALLISRDITERKIVEQKLIDSEEKYRLITENVYDLIGILDKNFKYEFLNEKTFLRVLGYSNADLIGKSALNFIHPDDVELAATALKKGFETGEGTAEIRFKHKKGHWIWLEAIGKTFIDQDGHLKAQIISRDITEKKAIADKIRKSEEILRKFIEESRDGLVLTDTEGKIIEWNNGQEEIFDIKKLDVINKPIWDIFYQITAKEKLNQEYKIQLKNVINHAIKTGEGPLLNNLGEEEIEFADGKKKVIQQLIFPIKSNSYYMLGAINRDVTKFKVAEQELKESEEKFRVMAEQSYIGILIIQDYDVKYSNHKLAGIIGYDKEEIENWEIKDIIKIIYEEDQEKFIEIVRKKYQNEINTIKNFQFRALTKSGEIKWLEVDSRTVPFGDGLADLTSIMDITERKLAEQKLQESEKILNDFIQSATDSITIWDSNLNLLEINKIALERMGMHKEAIIGKNMIEIIPEIKETGRYDKYLDVLKTGNPITFEGIRTLPGFKEGYYNINAFKVGDGLGVMSADITDRKLAEEKLKDSELRFRELYEEAPNGYFSIRADGKIIRCNKAATNLLGYSKEELLKMSVLNLYMDTEDGTLKAKEVFQGFLKGKQIKDEELQMKKKNGEPIWISLTVKPILDGNGKVIESQSMIIDIRKRKKAELEVANLAKFPSENPSAVLRVDCEKIIYANKAAENLFDIRSEDKLPKILKNYVENTNNEKIVKSFEVNLKDRIYSLTITPVKDLDYVNIYGMDITDRKVAEQKIIDSEKKYRDAFERSNLYKDLFAHDINNLLQIINSSAELISYQLNGVENASDIQNISEIIKKQVQRGSKLVSNVRTLSDLEDKDIELGLLDSCEILKSSIDFINKAYSEREISININCKEDKYLVHANELLHDVFDNLLINAIKYNENQKIEINIDVLKELKENRNYIKFKFKDNAIGIPDEKKSILFKEGYRKEKGPKGLGLGLSLVYKIVHSFDGKIWVEDRVRGDYSKGSKFFILIPESSS